MKIFVPSKKPRSDAARVLADARYRKRVVRDRKKYTRKGFTPPKIRQQADSGLLFRVRFSRALIGDRKRSAWVLTCIHQVWYNSKRQFSRFPYWAFAARQQPRRVLMPVQINEATIGRRFEEVGFARTLADLKKAGATTDQVSFLERLEAERPTSEKVKARYADEGLHATCAWLTRVRAPDVFFSQLARLDEEASKPSKPAPEKEARTPTAEKVATMYATEGRAATLAWLVRVSAENRFFTQVANIDQVAQKTRREAEEKAGRVQMRRAADRLFGKYAGSGGPTRKTGKTARERAKKAAKGGK